MPAPVPAAELSDLKLTGNLEARFVDPVDSATATAGMPVEAVLTQPMFKDNPPQLPQLGGTTVPTAAPRAHGKLYA